MPSNAQAARLAARIAARVTAGRGHDARARGRARRQPRARPLRARAGRASTCPSSTWRGRRPPAATRGSPPRSRGCEAHGDGDRRAPTPTALDRLVGRRARAGGLPPRPRGARSCPSARCCTRDRRIAWDAHVRADAGGRPVRHPLRGLGRQRRRGPARSSSGGACALAPCHHWRRGRPDDRHHHAPPCRCSSSRTARTATAPTPPSTRGSARSCASAPTTRRVIARLRWLADGGGAAAGRGPARARRPRPAPADGPGAAHGRRDAPAQRRRLGAPRPRAHAAPGARGAASTTRWRAWPSSSPATTSSS